MREEIYLAQKRLKERKSRKFIGQLHKMASQVDGEISMQDHRKLSFCMGDDEVVETSNVYYCTEKGKIKGVLEVSPSRIFFEPQQCKENEHIANLRPFQVCIDVGDVIST